MSLSQRMYVWFQERSIPPSQKESEPRTGGTGRYDSQEIVDGVQNVQNTLLLKFLQVKMVTIDQNETKTLL